jgi:uncharacterized protein
MFRVGKYKDKRLRKSTFGHFFLESGIVCAYNALKIITVYFPETLYSYIRAVEEKTIREVLREVPEGVQDEFVDVLTQICDAHIFIPEDYEELGYLKKIKEKIFIAPAPRVMVLHVTDYCNLSCRYCFIEGNIGDGYKRQNMSQETMKKSIDKFKEVIKGKNFPQRPSIVFYGGEPLYNWNVIKYGLEYISSLQELGILTSELDKVLITNGTLVSQEIARELERHNVLPAVSVDGPQEIHDANRVYRNGMGSFEKTIQGFYTLREAGLKPTIASVLTENSISRAEEIIHFFLDDLKVKALGFNHVSIVPNVSTYNPVYEEQVAESILKVQDIIQESYPDVYERRMNRKINCFLDRHILRADCTGCGEQMSISPDGQIGICQGYMGSRKTFANSVFEDQYSPLEDPVFWEWSRRSPLNMEKCFSCSALSTCGGGCPRNADFIHGFIWKIDSAFCHFAQKAQEWMIWKKYQKIIGT